MPRATRKTIKFKDTKNAIKTLLQMLGYDLRNNDIKDTPSRVAKLLIEETEPPKGETLKKLLQTFPSEFESMVCLRNHKSFTRCPHHLERVILNIHIGYIPSGRLIGLSKLARIADYFSQGLMLQEEVAEGIARGLSDALKPKGIAVFIEGEHLCMQARGIKTTGTITASKMLGVFLEASNAGLAAREEFFNVIGRRMR